MIIPDVTDYSDVKLLKTWINRTVGEREMRNCWLVSEFKRGVPLPWSSLKSRFQMASSNVQSRTEVADSFKPHTSPVSLPSYSLTLLQGEKTHWYANQVSHQPPRLSVWGTTLPKRESCFFSGLLSILMVTLSSIWPKYKSSYCTTYQGENSCAIPSANLGDVLNEEMRKKPRGIPAFAGKGQDWH